MPRIEYRVFILLGLASFLACREDPVVSTYKPTPKPIDVAIELPEIKPGPSQLETPISLPATKRFSIKGKLSGARSFKEEVNFAAFHINPAGIPNTIWADGFMKFEPIGDDEVEYSAVVEPIQRSGAAELHLKFNQEPHIVLRAHLAD